MFRQMYALGRSNKFEDELNVMIIINTQYDIFVNKILKLFLNVVIRKYILSQSGVLSGNPYICILNINNRKHI